MNEKDWLDTATEKIRFGPDRKAVRKELEAHLDDLREASGLEEDAALEAMGDPEAIAEELGRLHRPWLGYLWRTSQIILAGAAAVYCLMLVMLATDSGRSYLFPPYKLYEYLTWDSRSVMGNQAVLAERMLSSDETLKIGGYTIQVDRAALCQITEDGARWDLYLDLDVNLNWRGEPLDWYAISDMRDSTGQVSQTNRQSASTAWAYWQKIAFVIKSLPEDAEWAELDFGYGELRRTLHIDLAEEAET